VRARTDLALVAALAVVAFVIAVATPSGLAVVRLPAAIALVVVLPGYALAAAILPPARTAEWVVVSLALSIAATILVGLLLELVGAHLTTAPWMGLLAALTLAAAFWGARNGRSRALSLPHVGLRGAEIGAIGAALVLLGGAAALGFTPLAAPSGTQGTTALGICGPPTYPCVPSGEVRVSVISDALHTETWRVRVLVAAGATRSFGPFRLRPGATWSRVIAVGPYRPQVQAMLYDSARPSAVYRRTWLRYQRASAATVRRERRASSAVGGP